MLWSEEIRASYLSCLVETPLPEMQHQEEIYDLLGERIVKELLEFIRSGTLDRSQIQKMSYKMKAAIVFNHCMGRQLNLIDTLCRMLDYWFQNEIFSLQPQEAKALLVDILKDTSPLIVSENIKNLAKDETATLSTPAREYKDVPDMLRQLNLAELIPIFIQEELNFEDIADLTNDDMIEIGVSQLKQRKILLQAVEGLKHLLKAN